MSSFPPGTFPSCGQRNHITKKGNQTKKKKCYPEPTWNRFEHKPGHPPFYMISIVGSLPSVWRPLLHLARPEEWQSSVGTLALRATAAGLLACGETLGIFGFSHGFQTYFFLMRTRFNQNLGKQCSPPACNFAVASMVGQKFRKSHCSPSGAWLNASRDGPSSKSYGFNALKSAISSYIPLSNLETRKKSEKECGPWVLEWLTEKRGSQASGKHWANTVAKQATVCCWFLACPDPKWWCCDQPSSSSSE